MTNNTLFMVDLSSNNGPCDLKRHWDAGFRVLALKASEGTDYAWQEAHALAKQWHSYGGIVLHYHFLTPGNAAAQADWLYTTVKADLGVGDRFVVDVETHGESGADVNTFIDRLATHDPRTGLIYGSPSFLRDNGVGKHRGWWLWLAQYGQKADVPPSWRGWALWQYTNRGVAPGISGAVDISYVKPWIFHATVVEGDKSYCVLVLKQRLKQLGYGGFVMNQTYGSGLRRAVAKFKRDRQLPNRNGSVCGQTAWAALYK